MPQLPVPAQAPVPPPLTDRDFILTADFGDYPTPPDQNYFLELLDRDLPTAYVEGLKSGGGYELLRGEAAVGARLALALGRWDAGTLAGYATIGQKARGWVYLYRAKATAGGGTVNQGTLVGTRDRRLFRTLSDVVFGPTELGPLAVQVEAVIVGYDHNVDGEQPTAFGDAIPGQIDSVWLLLQTPAFFDASIQVRNVGPTVGGQDAQLEQLARERGITPRLQSESVDAFRMRIKALVRAVTPTGMEQSITAILRRWSPFFNCAVIDSWDPRYQGGYDAPIPSAPNFDTTLFRYDPIDTPVLVQNRWLSYEGGNGGEVILVLPQLPCLLEQTFFLDDTAANVAQHATPDTDGGVRSYSYLDLPDILPSDVFPCGVEGGDGAAQGTYAACVALANDLKPAGVSVVPLLDGLD